MKTYKNTFGTCAALRTVVTYLPNHAATVGEPVEVGSFLELCNVSPQHAAQVDELRRTTDKARRKQLKAALPCIIPAALYSGTHKANDAHTLTGLLCVDIDRHDNTAVPLSEWENLPRDLMASQVGAHVVFVGESASGWQNGGYFVLFMIQGNFDGVFNSLRRWFALQGVNVDTAARNVNRCRALSFQTRPPVVNPQAVPYTLEYYVQRAAPVAYTKPQGAQFDDLKRATAAVNLLKARQIDIVPTFEPWARCAFALATLGEQGRTLFHSISEINAANYDYKQADARFTRALAERNGRVSLNSFFALVYASGVRPDEIKY